jgi:hypothetical protein
MTYGQAIDLIHSLLGKKVTRSSAPSHHPPGTFIRVWDPPIARDTVSVLLQPYVGIWWTDNSVHPWTPGPGDQTATDWIAVTP